MKTPPPKKAIRRVLKEAAEHERFFDLSDAERLTWMIERAFELGRRGLKRTCGPARGWSERTGRKNGDRV